MSWRTPERHVRDRSGTDAVHGRPPGISRAGGDEGDPVTRVVVVLGQARVSVRSGPNRRRTPSRRDHGDGSPARDPSDFLPVNNVKAACCFHSYYFRFAPPCSTKGVLMNRGKAARLMV